MVSIGTVSCLLMVGTGRLDAEFLILLFGMSSSALGVALGAHLIIRDQLPPRFGRLVGGSLGGGLAGAILFVIGFSAGALLANRIGARPSEGTAWAVIFLPFWVLSSGGSAVFARYLVWPVLGSHLLVAVVTGGLGALIGDSLMTLILIRPFTIGPHFFHLPVAITAGFGALVASGLAWAERKISPSDAAAGDRLPTDRT